MYPITDRMKELFAEKQRQTVSIAVQLKEGSEGEDFTVTEADIVSGSFSLDRYSATGENIEIGSATAAEVRFTLDNSDGRFDGISLGGAKLFIRLGIKDTADPDANMHYMDCGYFTVDENPKPLTKISVAALDNMMKFDNKVDWSKFAFPMTVKNIVSVCCTECGVTLSPSVDFESLPNGEYWVANKPESSDITYRQLIQWSAEITGTCAFADWNGHLRLSWCQKTDVHINTSNRYSSETDESITITGVQVVDEDKSIHLYGEEGYVFNVEGNELIQTGAYDVAANLGAVLCGFTYVPFECSCFPMPFLYPMDVISFTDIKGNTFDTVVTAHVYTLNGTSSLKSVGESAEQKNYSSSAPFTKRESMIIKSLKKEAEKKVSNLEQKTLDLNGALANALGLYATEKKNEDGSVEFYYHSKPVLEECKDGDVIFCLNAGGFGVCTSWDENGNPVFENGVNVKTGEAIWRYLSAHTITASLIRAGRLESNDGSAYFDLDEEHIGVTEKDSEGEELFNSQFSPFGLEMYVKLINSIEGVTLTEAEEATVKKILNKQGFKADGTLAEIALYNAMYKTVSGMFKMAKAKHGVNISGADINENTYASHHGADRFSILKTTSEGEAVNTSFTADGIESDGKQTFKAPELYFEGNIIPRIIPKLDSNGNMTSFDDITENGDYVGEVAAGNGITANYGSCPTVESATFRFKVSEVGIAKQKKQRMETCHKTKPEVLERFYYQDGWGEWIDVRGTSMISATIASLVTKEATGESQVLLTTGEIKGNKFTLKNGAIVVGPGVDFIEVSASACMTCKAQVNAAAKNITVKLNGNVSVQSMNSSWSTTGVNFQLNITPKLVSVKEGDVITFWWYATEKDELHAQPVRTYLTVKEV